MKKTSFLLAMAFLISLALLFVASVVAPIWVEEERRDPTTGYDPPPGESFSWVYQAAYYNPQTQKYSNIQQDHNYGWVQPPQGEYEPNRPHNPDEDHPWAQTYVRWRQNNQSQWMLDTSVEIAW